MHHEIERKYLIRPLSDGFLRAQPGCEVWEIDQTYLLAPLGETHRVRRIVESGTERFRLTVKRRLSDLTSEEDEREIAPRTVRIAAGRGQSRTSDHPQDALSRAARGAGCGIRPLSLLERPDDSGNRAGLRGRGGARAGVGRGHPRRHRRPALQERPPRRAGSVRRNLTGGTSIIEWQSAPKPHGGRFGALYIGKNPQECERREALPHRARLRPSIARSAYSIAAKASIASEILICCGQTASQLWQCRHAVGRLSSGSALSAIGAMKPPPVKLCSLYSSSSEGMSRPCGQWLTQ